ncbi:MAG TPA: alcohol dehydrogenase catalytic domain-containing protein [Candidatus Dormibacteraeota bacterium]|nr:alcohol dehydrogenase catalytic domain-containing protein [Candidatus Dormibacteraeota bacterium]
MRALVFDPAPRRLPLAGVASRIHSDWALGPLSLLALRELPEPSAPSPEWVRLRVVGAGICGSDVKEVLLQAAADNPLSGLVSFPHVPGHEVVARVEDPGSSSSLVRGQVVALDPWVGCVARGLVKLCPACASGFPPHCRCQPDGGPWGTGRGLHLGNIRGLPGGFAEVLHAHPSQCHPLPEGLDPTVGVLADPLAVGLHAVERAGAEPKGPILVLGAGTIGLGLALAARARWPDLPVWVTAAWSHQRGLISQLGAEPLPAVASAVVPEVARRTGARLVRPWRGGPWALGAGAALVLDSIGSSDTTELALRCLAPRGRIVVVGVAKPARTETTLAYYKEAEIIGCNGYGRSAIAEGTPHLLDLALAILAEQGEELGRWCTHRFPLSSYRAAFALAANPQRGAAIKVSLQPEEGGQG